MLLGEYEHTLDPKGRLAIPAKFRAALGDGAVVTPGLDGCLTVYPKKEWEKLAEKLAALPINEPNARSFSRQIFSGAADIESDKQNRILLPLRLRQYANLTGSALVVGNYNRIEIWNKEAWREYSQNATDNFSDIASQLGEVTLN
jgi:transcriptional regulator MraZ